MGNCGSSDVKERLLGEEVKVGSGARLEDDYKVVGDALGYGRVAVVREGYHRESKQEVAVKACSKRVLSTRPDRISKTNEVEALLRVWQGPTTCSHIIRLFGTYEDNYYVYIVTELARGGDLFQNMAAKDAFSEEDVAKIGQQLLEAIHHCHNCGVVHRDLKPENILLAEPEGFDIKLVDFGSAALIKPGEVLRDFMATPFYAAPEVWDHAYGPQADVWSLGAILHVLLTGLPPMLTSKMVHNNDTWRNLQVGKAVGLPPSTSPALLDLLEKLLEPDPDRRITPAEALAHPWITGGVPRGTENLEGSMRGIKLYARVRKFQKAAVVLLSVLLDSKELRAIGRRLRALAQTGGSLREVELEKLLEELGLTSQADSLRRLRCNLLGGSSPSGLGLTPGTTLGDNADVAVEFAVDDFLELLECRKLALKHLGKANQWEDTMNGETGGVGLGELVSSMRLTQASPSSRFLSSRLPPRKPSPGRNRIAKATSAGNLSGMVDSLTSPGGSVKSGTLGVSRKVGKEGLDGERSSSGGMKQGEKDGGRSAPGSSVHGDMLCRSFLVQA